jgi:DNA-binding CsgD family transcriptional regulator
MASGRYCVHSDAVALELIDLIYGAAGDPKGWPTLLHRLGEVFQSTGSTIHHHQIPSQKSNFSDDWNVDPAAIGEYTSYYGLRNIWRTYRPHVFFPGSVNSSEMMCPESVFERSEYYNDFLKRYNFFHSVAITLRDDDRAMSNLSLFKPRSGAGFGDEELRLLRILAPHLVRALQLHNRIHGLERRGDLLQESLNQIHAAVIVVDAAGRVLHANEMATVLSQRQRYLRITPNGVQIARASEHKELSRLIRGATQVGFDVNAQPGGAMSITREQSHRPLQVLVLPINARLMGRGRMKPAALLFVTDPDSIARPPSDWLRQLYGLSRAESRLAQALMSGCDLKEVSEQFQLKASTVRSQLKSIFAKTQTNRQSELLRLLLVGPTRLAQPPHNSCTED